jgi:PAS domain-containing protein
MKSGKGERSEWAAAEQAFQQSLEGLRVPAYTCDADGLITAYNTLAVTAWGRSPKLNDPADRYCGSLLLFSPAGASIKHEDCWMGKSLRTKSDFIGHEVVIERPDGTRLMVVAHASPIRDDNGEMVGAVNVLVELIDRDKGPAAAKLAREVAQVMHRAKERYLATLTPAPLVRPW